MRVLVTGANGMIGREVCAALGTAGFAVRAAVRRPQQHAPAPEVVVTGELGPGTVWSRTLDGVDAVVHTAGHAHGRGRVDEAACAQVNVEGTRSLAAAAARAGTQHVIYLSTAKVHGEESQGAPFTEQDVPRPADPYARSKLAAELVLRDRRREFATTVVRAPLVYGPGVRANFFRLMWLVDRGVPLPVGNVMNQRSLVFVGNLADAIRHVLVSEPSRGETYLVSDGRDVSTAELATTIAHALKRNPRVLTVPSRARGSFLMLAGLSGSARRLLHSFQVDSSRIRNELGWSAPFTFEEGVARTVNWYRSMATQR